MMPGFDDYITHISLCVVTQNSEIHGQILNIYPMNIYSQIFVINKNS